VKPSQNQGTMMRWSCSLASLRVRPGSVSAGTENLPPPVGSVAPTLWMKSRWLAPTIQIVLNSMPVFVSTGNALAFAFMNLLRFVSPCACWRKKKFAIMTEPYLCLNQLVSSRGRVSSAALSVSSVGFAR
jgi:hypothetical protein